MVEILQESPDFANNFCVRIARGWVVCVSPEGEELFEDTTTEYIQTARAMPKEDEHEPDQPLEAWKRFHLQHGKHAGFDEPRVQAVALLQDAVRNALVYSMKTVFAIKMETAAQMWELGTFVVAYPVLNRSHLLS
jgi:hypothetical protein